MSVLDLEVLVKLSMASSTKVVFMPNTSVDNRNMKMSMLEEEEEARMLRMASLGPDWEKGLISIITTALAAWYVVVVFRLHGEDFLSSFDLSRTLANRYK